jgi:hemerythrin-like domain-containing protein
MKRNENLLTLSQEHHDGLVVVRCVKRGSDLGVNPFTVADYVMDVWQNHLDPHFTSEEEILLPAMPHGDEYKARLLREHAAIREKVEKIRLRDAELPETLRTFADILDDHIRFEERDLFPFAEKDIPPEKLAEVGHLLHKSHVEPDEGVWPEWRPGNKPK